VNEGGVVEIGNWKATPELGSLYRQIRDLGLEQHVAELDAFGFTVLEPGHAAPVEWTDRLRDALLDVAERRTGVKHDIETGVHGVLDVEPAMKSQYSLYFLLLEDPIFQEAVLNPCALALQTYLLDFTCRLSSLTGFVKWQDESGYGPSLGLHQDSLVRHSIPVGKDSHTANCNWLLTDYTKENGALAVVPGSHRRTHRPDVFKLEGVDEAIPIEAPAGSLVVFHGNLWHGAFPRTNPGLRLTLSAYYSRTYLQVNEDYRAAITDDVLARNPKRLAMLLGFGEPFGWTSADGPRFSRSIEVALAAAAEAGLGTPGGSILDEVTGAGSGDR
jgi:hypothetical protein